MPTLIERILQIDGPDNSRRVIALSSFAFLTAGAYVTCRSVADALFLDHVGPEYLPSIHLVATIAVVLLTIISTRWRKRPRGLLPTQLLLAIASLVVPLFNVSPSEPVAVVAYGFLYVLAQLHGTVGMIFLTLLLQEQFHEDVHPSVFSLVGAGATLASIIFGGVILSLVSTVGPVNLLYIVALLDVVAVIPICLLSTGTVSADSTVSDCTFGQSVVPKKKSHMSLANMIMLLIGIKVAALTLVEFQWKVAVAAAHMGDAAEVTAYFGSYYIGVSLITGFVQLFLSGRLLQRFGVVVALLILPMSLLCGSLLVLMISKHQIRLWVATVLKGTESLRRGINDPALQLLFKALPATERHPAITRTHGIAKPLAELAAALLLQSVALVITPHDVSWLLLILIGLWLYGVSRINSLLKST